MWRYKAEPVVLFGRDINTRVRIPCCCKTYAATFKPAYPRLAEHLQTPWACW
jgi:hypothetical protein